MERAILCLQTEIQSWTREAEERHQVENFFRNTINLIKIIQVFYRSTVIESINSMDFFVKHDPVQKRPNLIWSKLDPMRFSLDSLTNFRLSRRRIMLERKDCQSNFFLLRLVRMSMIKLLRTLANYYFLRQLKVRWVVNRPGRTLWSIPIDLELFTREKEKFDPRLEKHDQGLCKKY